ncbi:hypothetical protein [Streptomyces laurentii]
MFDRDEPVFKRVRGRRYFNLRNPFGLAFGIGSVLFIAVVILIVRPHG